MYGTDTEPWILDGDAAFYQDAVGSDFGGQVNPLFFGAFPDLEYDTWWTIGAAPGDADGLNSAFDENLTSFADWNNGGDFVVNTFIGGSIFVVPGAQMVRATLSMVGFFLAKSRHLAQPMPKSTSNSATLRKSRCMLLE